MSDSEKPAMTAVNQSDLELVEGPQSNSRVEDEKTRAVSQTAASDGSSHASSSRSDISESSVDPEENEDLELEPVTTSTSVHPPPITVSAKYRRGLLAQLALLPEVEEPKHYPRKTKWFITFIIAVAAMAAPMGSAIFFRS